VRDENPRNGRFSSQAAQKKLWLKQKLWLKLTGGAEIPWAEQAENFVGSQKEA
jgi:hypothetical protein